MLLKSLQINDAFDILIIAILLYQGYKILQGSRAWNVFRGLIILAILWFLSVRFNLDATRWFFDRAGPAAFIALVVLFQPELRSALERVGRGRGKHSAEGDPVQEIMVAVRDFAANKRGALIAIEQQVSLAEYGKVGSKLNSPVNAALLQTIFASQGPLHDGAVIIKNDIITHAGAVFPVSSQRDGVPVHHGTRHRAALGMSEESDALLIVVSEERGTVSLAKNGGIKSDIPPSDVIKALREVYKDKR